MTFNDNLIQTPEEKVWLTLEYGGVESESFLHCLPHLSYFFISQHLYSLQLSPIPYHQLKIKQPYLPISIIPELSIHQPLYFRAIQAVTILV